MKQKKTAKRSVLVYIGNWLSFLMFITFTTRFYTQQYLLILDKYIWNWSRLSMLFNTFVVWYNMDVLRIEKIRFKLFQTWIVFFCVFLFRFNCCSEQFYFHVSYVIHIQYTSYGIWIIHIFINKSFVPNNYFC